MPELVAVAEIVELLSASKQRVYQILDEDDPFPRPVDRLTVGQIWRRSDIEAWARATGRAQ